MRAIPLSIAQHLVNQKQATEPVIFADIFYQNEGLDALDNAYRLRGDGDASRAEDLSIKYDAHEAGLLLAHGTARPVDVTGAIRPSYGWQLSYSLQVVDQYHTYDGFSLNEGFFTRYVHDGYDYKVLDGQTTRDFKFTASATQLIQNIAVVFERVVVGGNDNTLVVDVSAQLFDDTGAVALGYVATQTIMPSNGQVVRQFNGVDTQVFAGRSYVVRFTLTPRNYSYLTAPAKLSTIYNAYIAISGFSVADAAWSFALDDVSGKTAGFGRFSGTYQYAAIGRVVRNFNVGGIPANYGELSIRSAEPLGAALQLSYLYATNNLAVAAQTPTNTALWSVVPGPLGDGMSLPPYQFFRAVFDLQANAGRDASPSLNGCQVLFSGSPITLGTIADGKGVRALHNISACSQSIDAKFKTTMIGEMRLEIAPEPEIKVLLQKPLRGKQVRLRAGVRGGVDTLDLYTGVVNELSWSAGRYYLTLQDPINLVDTSVPNTRHRAWSQQATLINDLVVMGDKAFRALQAQAAGAVQPVTNTAAWAAYPSVWIPLSYAQGTHLADIVLDLLSNRINMPDRYIDAGSINTIKTLRPSRSLVAALTIEKPTNARELLDSAAQLLEAQWVVRAGRMSLIPDPVAGAAYITTLTAHDIAEGLEWRRGFSDIKNEVLMLSGYDAVANQFNRGQAIADGESVGTYAFSALTKIQDKFGLSEAELAAIGNAYLLRWRNGRRVVRATAHIGSLAIEAGDVIRLISAQLPESDSQVIIGLVLQTQLDWQSLTNKLTLQEI